MVVDMNDATRLIGDLHQKLADLDHKVAAYRQDMATEFQRYSHDLLQNFPINTRAEVDRVVAASLDEYPALGPAIDLSRDHPDSPPPPPTENALPLTDLDHRPRLPATLSPSPSQSNSAPASSVPSHAGTATLTSPDSVYDRERDREFHGLFTPAYLPLLDSAQPPPAATLSPALSPQTKPAIDDDENMGRSSSGPRNDRSVVQVSTATQTPDRPNHHRRATDDTTSSGTSEHSESKVRKSALRRTSSGPKTPASPRRVRFEFEGGEVLPTASPQSSEPSLVQSHTLGSSRSPPPPEDESMSVESLLGPDEDLGPPPKKVSSSQALRALSRAPLDASTVWTVVNPDAQGSDAEKENGSMATSDSESSLLANNNVAQSNLQSKQASKSVVTDRGRTRQPAMFSLPEGVNAAADDESDDNSSDDGFLAMAKPKSFANKKAILSPLSRSPTRTAPTPNSPSPVKSSSHVNSKITSGQREVQDDEDEDMFHFEGLTAPPRPRPRPAPIQEDEEEDDEVEADEPVTQTLYSTSPAVSIPKPLEPQIPAHLISGSVGSFNGRPVIMPVVKSVDVYQQAASLGDVSTFIGGLDGRSGVDDGDLSSYRASVGQSLFSGTPRSLTERMMMEEAQSQRRTPQRPR
ncbi:hypothetical protein C8034_v007629 [Colletotrichum sidae]|uniref:Uncharacterized protein n=1 Tax=Colletotrichum sidae TaxID=1347389 RepID=A0A4R8TS73_9PEZI|nr:hypothetical protein C8034_v007629 [Colletotrichum sidae]